MNEIYYVDGIKTTRESLINNAQYIDTVQSVKDIDIILRGYLDDDLTVESCEAQLLEAGETIIDGCLIILQGKNLFEA